MKIFTPPKSGYSNYYETGAFDLTWRFNAFMTFSFLGLVLAGILISFSLFILSVLFWLIPIVSLYAMKKTRKYEYVACAHVILGATIPGLILNIDLYPVHLVEPVFMLSSSFYAFIALRRKIGVASLLTQFIWFAIYILCFSNDDYVFSLNTNIGLLISLLSGMSVIGFLIMEFLQLRKTAEIKYVSTNKDLSNINQLVNAQNKEKTVMLKEIHHRVKNNLQVISSLLRLQSYEIEEESLKVHFQDAILRVSAMALIHEKMYQNENLSRINLENYIETLAGDLVRTHAQDVDIKLDIVSEIQELGNDTLVPVALILNELMTNSMKHAFEGKSEGFIAVKIKKTDREAYFNFVYRDSGEWKVTPKGSSFGLELITTLTEQLDGKAERTYENGTKYEFILRDLMRDLK